MKPKTSVKKMGVNLTVGDVYRIKECKEKLEEINTTQLLMKGPKAVISINKKLNDLKSLEQTIETKAQIEVLESLQKDIGLKFR